MLWKDLQKQSPDLTSTVDMIITRQPQLQPHILRVNKCCVFVVQGRAEE